MGKNKMFNFGKDDDYAFYELDLNGSIGVNIQKIWEELEDENKFIKVYSSYYNHEVMHKEIARIMFDLFLPMEERIVHKIFRHKLTKVAMKEIMEDWRKV